MKKSSAVLSLLLLAAAGSAYAVGVQTPAGAKITPIVQLGALIQAVAPAASIGIEAQPFHNDGNERAWANRVAAQAALPEGFSTARAAALVKRASELQQPSQGQTLGDLLGGAAPNAPKASAKEVLVAVNGVLADFTPEQIEKMPADQLHGVAGLILDQMKGQRTSVDASADAVGLAALSEARAAKILGLRARDTKVVRSNPGDDYKTLPSAVIAGTPSGVRQVLPVEKAEAKRVAIPQGADAEWFVGQRAAAARAIKLAADTVFRQYRAQDEAAQTKASGRVQNGTAYENSSRDTFSDLTGVVMTTAKAQSGGPSRNGSFVDFVLPAGMSLLELEQGVYLLPLPGRAPAWLRAQGVAGPDLAVPVTVLDQAKPS